MISIFFYKDYGATFMPNLWRINDYKYTLYESEMTIAPRVRGDMFLVFYFEDKMSMLFSKKERKNRYVWVYTRKSLHK